MKKYIVLVIAVVVSFTTITAQSNKEKVTGNRFTTIVQGGILEGQADKTFGQFQLVNGIQHNAWLYGIGIGIDYYGQKRSIPLFAAARKDILKGKRTPFVFADAGYNFSWLREEEKLNSWVTDYRASGGLFCETGIGYRFILKNKMALGFSAGYSYKQQQERYTRVPFFNPLFPTSTSKQQPDIFNYQFRRISIKLHCSF